MNMPSLFMLLCEKHEPFADSVVFENNDVFLESSEYDKVLPVYSGDASVVVAGGGKWQDVLWSHKGILLFSEKILTGLQREGITGFSHYNVSIESVDRPTLRKKENPKYYWIKPNNGILLEPDAYGLSDLDISENGKKNLNKWERDEVEKVKIPVQDSWNGCDISFISNPYPHGYVCSFRLLELARKDKWTNALFTPIDYNRNDLPPVLVRA